MKTHKLFASVLLILLCLLCLTACDAVTAEPSDEPSAGPTHKPAETSEPEEDDDWRSMGLIDAYGTITRSGTDTDVCIVLNDTGADFYYDEAEQIYYDGVMYPIALPEEMWEYADITFDDINGDMQSDVQLLFHYEDGSEIYMVWLDEEDGYTFSEELSNIEVNHIDDYVGLWEYVGEDMWVYIYSDNTWDLVDYSQEVIGSGSVVASKDFAELYDETGESLTLYLSEDGELLDDEGGMFIRVDEIVPTAYFDRFGLEINALADNGTYLLENGMSGYKSNTSGSGYIRGDVYWEVNTIYDAAHDGMREIEFDAVCYIPQGIIPSNTPYSYSTSSELYDYYTGKWLTSSSTYGDSERGENHFVHTIEWNGETHEIEFFFSIDWEPYGDWYNVLYKSYVVYIPEGYDGLIFAAQAKPDNYKDDATRFQLEYISPGADIMSLVTLDPYTGLYFNIY